MKKTSLKYSYTEFYQQEMAFSGFSDPLDYSVDEKRRQTLLKIDWQVKARHRKRRTNARKFSFSTVTYKKNREKGKRYNAGMSAAEFRLIEASKARLAEYSFAI